ncbi:4Fe-4S dicluster domain-containing protein [bacterium]|nr:4Fe-4S dicluster domain-containing protein [bacterium]
MRKPKLRELKEAISSIFSKPFTTEFPFKTHTPAERFRGKPEYNQDTCVGCGACFQVCPSNAIEMIDTVVEGKGKRVLVQHPKDCLFCGECERNCITETGIQLTKVFDVSYFDEKKVQSSIEHNLVVCKHCKEVIGAEKHILWTLRKLGNLAYSQPVMISGLMSDLELKVEVEETVVAPIQRTDILKVVCPKCRRLAFITDEKRER